MRPSGKAVLALWTAVTLVGGVARFVRADDAPRPQIVRASWYGSAFHNRTTASGRLFDQHDLTAAHRTLPLGTRLRVTNLHNGRSVLVEITDRGPYCRGRELDLSYGAARALRFVERGVGRVKIEVLPL